MHLAIGGISGRIVERSVFDLSAIDFEVHRSRQPINPSNQARWKQCSLCRPPVPSVDLDETNAPISIIDEEVVDVADQAVNCVNSMPDYGFHAAEMRIIGFGL